MAHGGDFGGWHSQSVFLPERKTRFVILTNGEGGTPLNWTDLLKPLVDGVVLAERFRPHSVVRRCLRVLLRTSPVRELRVPPCLRALLTDSRNERDHDRHARE